MYDNLAPRSYPGSLVLRGRHVHFCILTLWASWIESDALLALKLRALHLTGKDLLEKQRTWERRFNGELGENSTRERDQPQVTLHAPAGSFVSPRLTW